MKQDVGLAEFPPCAGAAADQLLAIAKFDVGDQGSVVRKITLDFVDRVDPTAIEVGGRHIELLALQFDRLAVDEDFLAGKVEELKAVSVCRDFDLRDVSALNLDPVESASTKKVDMWLENVVHLLSSSDLLKGTDFEPL